MPAVPAPIHSSNGPAEQTRTIEHRPSPVIRRRADPLRKHLNPTFDKITGMKSEKTDSVVIRFSVAFKTVVFLITLAALLVCLPLALQAIPAEAFGYLFILVLLPGILVYFSFLVGTYQLHIQPDRIAAEAIPNPFLRTFQCPFAGVSGIQKDTGWSDLLIYRFHEAEPYRIKYMEFLDANPVLLLEEITSRLPADIFMVRATDSLRRWWKWHRLLMHAVLLLFAGWACLRLLSGAGALAAIRLPWDGVSIVLLVAAFAAGLLDFGINWMMNRKA
jgi:hypothetical protein